MLGINRLRSFLQAGKLNTYRFCDNVWTFLLSDVEFRDVQELTKGETVKIVACDGKSKFYFEFVFRWSNFESFPFHPAAAVPPSKDD